MALRSEENPMNQIRIANDARAQEKQFDSSGEGRPVFRHRVGGNSSTPTSVSRADMVSAPLGSEGVSCNPPTPVSRGVESFPPCV